MQDVKIDRNKYIGGSDIPIVMGISPFKSRFDLLLEKAGYKEDDFEGNCYTEYGNALEPKIRDYINQNQGDKFEEGKTIVDDIRCHTDGINETTVLEIKTTSQVHTKIEEYKIYLVQLLFYMQYTKREKGKLAVYNRTEDFNEEFEEKRLSIFDIDINDYADLLNQINLSVNKFKEDLEKVKANPFITEEELYPDNLKELSKIYIDNIERINQITEENKKIADLLKIMFKESNIKNCSSGKKKITYVAETNGKETTIETFNIEKFKEENNELFKEYSEEIISYNLNEEKLKTEKSELYSKYIESTIKKGQSKASYLKITDIN